MIEWFSTMYIERERKREGDESSKDKTKERRQVSFGVRKVKLHVRVRSPHCT